MGVDDLVPAYVEAKRETERTGREFKQVSGQRAFQIGLLVDRTSGLGVEQERPLFRRQVAAQDARVREVHVDAGAPADRQDVADA